MSKRLEDAEDALRRLRDVRERRARGEQAEFDDSSGEDEHYTGDESSGEASEASEVTQPSDDDDDFVSPAEPKRRRVEKAEAADGEDGQASISASSDLARQRRNYVSVGRTDDNRGQVFEEEVRPVVEALKKQMATRQLNIMELFLVGFYDEHSVRCSINSLRALQLFNQEKAQGQCMSRDW
jgi:hypothetical protein